MKFLSYELLQWSARLGISVPSECELGHPKSLPNKIEHVRTEKEANECNVAQLLRLTLSHAVHFA
jgi:hypothetical protein